MSDNEWLKDVKVGDEVAVWHSSFGAGYYDFRKVEKVHKVHFEVGGSKFRRDTGRQAGESWHPAYLRQSTPELKAEVAAERRLNTLAAGMAKVNWRKIPLETLEVLNKIIEGANGQK